MTQGGGNDADGAAPAGDENNKRARRIRRRMHPTTEVVRNFMPNQRRCKVYFLGSGAIAVPVLKALLHDQRIELVGIGTQPDRPSGRRRELHPTPLGSAADGWGLPAERIASVNSRDFLDRLRCLAPDIVLVVSFGQLLKDELLNLPRSGCVNIHGSLLPRYRGASPITAAIANLDAVTEIGRAHV